MPYYEYKCDKCKIIWENFMEKIPAKVPQKKKCPKCKKFCQKEMSVGTFKIAGNNTYKWSKSDVTKMYNEMISDSKERLKSPESPYAKYYMDPNVAIRNGEARKLSDKESSSKAERERVLKRDAQNRMSRRRSK